jgi:hypothetical protein
MNWWTVLIYGVAVVLALQGLFAQMTAHRNASLRRFFEEELKRRELEAAQQAAKPPEPEPTKNNQKSRAA